MKSILLVFAISFAAAACVGQKLAPQTPVNFIYKIDGEALRLSALRGRPIVLVLMRTSDLTSQMYMVEVTKAHHRIAGRIRFLVLTIEPTETPFVTAYAETQETPFAIGTAEPSVALGNSTLGKIPVVPTTYFINSNGRVIDMAAGVVTADDLVRALKRLEKQ